MTPKLEIVKIRGRKQYERDMAKARAQSEKPKAGTWGWIIHAYRTDDLSPIHEVKANTRASYLEVMRSLGADIGTQMVSATTFESLKRWKKSMEQAGRSTSYIHRMFTHLRIVANYGLAVKPGAFRDVCSILGSGQLKVRAPKPRTAAPTQDQVMAIIMAADAAGDAPVALGLSLQWWLTLRAVDVRGQWLPDGTGRRWADGLTWDMVDLKAGTISKAQSKTDRHDGIKTIWDIAPIPGLLDRLLAIPDDQRIGPVIKRDGKPFEKEAYRMAFRRYAKAAGVPDDVCLMDLRAGAVNDGLLHGADRTQLQHAAGHKDGKTTERYIRARDVGANRVIQMRAGK